MALVLEQTDTLPGVTRGSGRNSEETTQLKEAVKGLTPIVVRGIEKSEFNAFQQKIRYAAREVGLKVAIRRSNDTNPDVENEGTVDVTFLGKIAEIAEDAPKATKTSKAKS